MTFRHMDLKKTLYSVADFIGWQADDTLDLTPSFQRRTVWKASSKSYLIDTILRGLPIPILFLRERATDLRSMKTVREVVDGQQRLHTIFSFVKPNVLGNRFNADRDSFVISSAHNKDVAGKHFSEFSVQYQQQILDYQFSVHVLPSSASDRDVLEIFRRMNSTGTKLNAQELRNANFSGDFASSVSQSSLRQLDRWRSWKVFSEDQIARMNEVELTADLYVFMMSSISGRSASSLDNIYKKFDNKFPDGEELERRFSNVFDVIDESVGRNLSNMKLSRVGLFYGLFSIYYDFLYGIGSPLKRYKANALPKAFPAALLDLDERISQERNVPAGVLESITKRTTHFSTRKTYIQYFLKQMRNAVA